MTQRIVAASNMVLNTDPDCRGCGVEDVRDERRLRAAIGLRAHEVVPAVRRLGRNDDRCPADREAVDKRVAVSVRGEEQRVTPAASGTKYLEFFEREFRFSPIVLLLQPRSTPG